MKLLRDSKPTLTRRDMLKTSVIGGGMLLADFHGLDWPSATPAHAEDPFRDGKKLGVVEFAEEFPIEMGKVLGAELDGRLYTDLSTLTPENPITPAREFYLRTCASKLLENDKPWTIRLAGLVREPTDISLQRLRALEKSMGVHLMECAGNTRAFHFGMMSVASWTGAPIFEVLQIANVEPQAKRVLVSGFDRYQAESTSSIPGASWIFTLDELNTSRAFLATQMNGERLSKDHGAPVRLLVPGWYGCSCIKWVNEITLVGDDIEATSQMQEYATRTYQQGVPQGAKDYRPATIEHAATPVRVERWLVNGATKYRVVGILWGGSRPVNVLEIRFNPEEEYVPVDSLNLSGNDSWSFWTHAWTPKKPGTYLIRLRVKDPTVPTKRLDSGYYLRSVEITEGA